MKKDIHPKDYRLVAFKDMSNNDIFITKSTANTAETIEHEGVEYPLVKMEIISELPAIFEVKKITAIKVNNGLNKFPKYGIKFK